jgi:ABC-type multidrug transport system fused ATPase/permease subunit
VRAVPFADPGTPETRSPVRFLLWTARGQWRTLAVGVSLGVVWMVAQALLPYAIGRGIDEGVATADVQATVGWALVVLAIGVVQATAGVFRHRFAVSNWLQAAFRSAQLVVRHTARTGPALTRRVTTGEVISTVASDAMRIGGLFDTSQRFIGAVVSYAVVAVILLRTSVPLGLLVLVGVPLLVLGLGPIVRPLQAGEADQREAVGKLTALGADTVAGLPCCAVSAGSGCSSRATATAPSTCGRLVSGLPPRRRRSTPHRSCCPGSFWCF